MTLSSKSSLNLTQGDGELGQDGDLNSGTVHAKRRYPTRIKIERERRTLIELNSDQVLK